MAKKCPTPEKVAWSSKTSALYATAHGAHGNHIYLCPCGRYHTSSRVRVKPKAVRR